MTDRDDAADGFLSRWARRKALVRDGVAPPEAPAVKVAAVPAPPPDPAPSANAPGEPAAGPGANDERPPPPTLADVAQLELGADYRRFVASDVTPEVKNAAMKKRLAELEANDTTVKKQLAELLARQAKLEQFIPAPEASPVRVTQK